MIGITIRGLAGRLAAWPGETGPVLPANILAAAQLDGLADWIDGKIGDPIADWEWIAGNAANAVRLISSQLRCGPVR